MNKSFAIQFKAVFLVIIFSLNMFVGFACSIGIEMGFNAPNHDEAEIKTTHTHTHHHGAHKTHDHKKSHTEKREKNGCCNDEVQKVQQLDKNINSTAKSTILLFTALLPPSFFQTYIVKLFKTNPSKYRERFFYPPPPNILVESQRFQI